MQTNRKNPRFCSSSFLLPCNPRKSPSHGHPFPARNPAKLGDFSLFSCLRTPVEPRKSQICVFLPLLSVGFNLWVWNFWAFFGKTALNLPFLS
ncbi:hypothetical protein SLEP1_g17217 [Rubroshorea leprosula]|uniref:Uncharacterized protein n=1 Tax=Rubroshorea leprosula TaxID=152421 RepID=A0AAV5IZ23_9ROSI|nr:hypothetical protein SLEP1_g17217 [Rubroshorea leprosula]